MIDVYVAAAVLMSLAAGVLGWVFSRTPKTAMVVATIFLVCALGLYWRWGSYTELAAYRHSLEQKQRVTAALKQYNNADEIIKALANRLQANPNSAKGWFLLGRLYASQKQFAQAKQAFEKAYQLDNKSVAIRLQLMQALYVTQGMQLTEDVKRLLQSVLADEPLQLDALNFAAADAYSHQRYKEAVLYWQKMLEVLPDGSKEKKYVLKAIAKAQKKLNGSETKQVE